MLRHASLTSVASFISKLRSHGAWVQMFLMLSLPFRLSLKDVQQLKSLEHWKLSIREDFIGSLIPRIMCSPLFFHFLDLMKVSNKF